MLVEVNRLPVSSDTRRVRLRRTELEEQLTRLEEEMRTYSRANVFVREEDQV